METKLSPKGMILDLCSQRSRLISMKDNLSDYSALLDFITDKDYYNEENLSIPSLKEISSSINISYDKLRRQLKKLYTEVSSYERTDQFPFITKTTKVLFYLKGFHDSKTFFMEGLKRIPSKGENVRVPYFQELVGTDCFYVSQVQHEFNDNEHEICVWLYRGFYNSYWDLRKDQAFETGELGFYDNNKEEFELKRLLDLKPGKAW